jgi:phage major head subunit gpT-like protein
MQITRGTLQTLGIAFKATFENALGTASTQYQGVTTMVPVTTGKTEYGWLGEIPNVREWVGDRFINNLERFAWSISNKDFEVTVGVDRNDILYDNLGIYTPKFTKMGNSCAAHKDLLIWPMMNAGFANLCYDGQYFFDTDHPVLDVNGVSQSVANTDGGAGTPWFLVAKNQVLNPIILQTFKDYEFVSKDQPDDDNVFMQKRYLYGADAIYNAGYGLWQTSWGSKQPLDAAHYATARAALLGMKGEYGRPLGLNAFTMYVPPTLEGAALQILNADRNADGSTNIWFKTADLVVVPWLA